MRRYAWPGNIRELENAIERAVVVGKGRQINPGDLPFVLASHGAEEVASLPLAEMEHRHIALVLAAEGGQHLQRRQGAADKPQHSLRKNQEIRPNALKMLSPALSRL